MEYLLKFTITTKRILHLIMILFILFILSSCMKKDDQNIKFDYEIIPYFSSFDDKYHEDQSYVFNQLSELETQGKITNSLIEKYDEVYFEHKLLVVMDLLQMHINYSGPAFTVQQINQYDSSLNVRLTHNITYYSDNTVWLVYIFIEIDKSELNSKIIENINIFHYNTERYYQIQTDIPNSIVFMFSPSWEGEHEFQISWNYVWFNGTCKMRVSKDFNTIDIYDMRFSEDTPNIYDLPTEAQIIDFTNSSLMTLVYGGESYLNTPII